MGAGLVLGQFCLNWNVNDQSQDQGQKAFNYLARIPAGIYIRITYVSTGATNVDVRPNFLFHKKV
jgi:hypothetical protein